MKMFSLQTKSHWIAWSLFLGAALFCIDHFVPFADIGIARCGPGYCTFPRGNRSLTDLCETGGVLDAIVASSQLLTLLFWISLPTLILGLARYSRIYRLKRASVAPLTKTGKHK